MGGDTGKASSWTKWLVGSSLALLVLAIGYVVGRPLLEPPTISEDEIVISPARLLDKSRAALAAEKFDEALEYAERVLEKSPKSADALLLAGEAAQRGGDGEQAVAYYQRVTPDAEDQYVTAQWAAGNSLLHLSRLADAEACFRAALAHDPNNVIALRRLAYILSIEGRRLESIDYLFRLIKLQQVVFEELTLLANLQQAVAESELIRESLLNVPSDHRPLLGQAALLRKEGKWDEAAAVIQQLADAEPGHLDAQAELGRWYLDEVPAAFPGWHAQLSDNADEHPDIWYVRGAWAQHHRLHREALRCYWECLTRYPSHAEANFRIGQVLQLVGQPEEAAVFLQRYRIVERLTETLKPLQDKGPEFEPILEVAGMMEELGRLWEAWGWYREALRLRPEEARLQLELDRLAKMLVQDPPRVLPAANPILKLDLSGYPLPEIKPPTGPADDPKRGARFVDVAADVGIRFTYNSGDDLREPGFHIFQEFGGGLGVLDFDADGWPDLYLGQGSQWPPRDGQQNDLDRLLRNLDGAQFVDVTQAARLGDERYTQGLAVADYDNDGFADLYAANIGGNRLYRNEGDGTFTDVTEAVGLSGQLWTTSAVLADVTGDGLPDLYEVNYLRGPEVFERVCREAGQLMACHPRLFDAEQDQLYVNLGDGRFQNVTRSAGIVNDHGKGLGVVAADFNDDRRLDLFVANDTTANAFFVNRGENADTAVQFDDQALFAGLAYDSDGRPQACMGVAVTDMDNDGFLELFVTNFYGESNTLYRQLSNEQFLDDTWSFGLREASRKLLGFGTQFLDSDLDGLPDLVVANGHVHDRSQRDPPEPFKMRPQYFHNLGDNRFGELEGDRAGAYFDQLLLGRSLVTLDYDRDGLPEFAVQDLYEPLQLLRNETPAPGHFVKLSLRGRSARDAIGARVEIKVGEQFIRRQLVAGDGFQCANERLLHLGLGDAQHLDAISVLWPSGHRDEFSDLAADREYVLVEGRGAFAVSRHAPEPRSDDRPVTVPESLSDDRP